MARLYPKEVRERLAFYVPLTYLHDLHWFRTKEPQGFPQALEEKLPKALAFFRDFFPRRGRGRLLPMRITLVDHPLVQHKLAHLRDKRTGPKDFRELAEEVAMLMAYEAMRDLELEETTVETPIAPARVKVLSGKKLALVAILRAGLVMVEGILKLVPHARVGHIGLYRDPESLNPVQYYIKLPPDIAERRAFLLDPMLATGGSASLALSLLKERGPPGSSSWPSSPPPRAWSASPRTTPTPRWWWRP